MCSDLSFLLKMFYELSKGRNSFLPLFLLPLFAIIKLIEVVLMRCPFCCAEMQQGKLRTRGENYFVPDGYKTPMLLYEKKYRERRGNPCIDRRHRCILRRELEHCLFVPEVPKVYCRLLSLLSRRQHITIC